MCGECQLQGTLCSKPEQKKQLHSWLQFWFCTSPSPCTTLMSWAWGESQYQPKFICVWINSRFQPSGDISVRIFFCTGASDVLLKDKTKKQTNKKDSREYRSQDSHKIGEVKKLGFKYCRKSHEDLSLVSSELGETEIPLVPNAEVNHLKDFVGSKESAPKRALPGPPSEAQRAGRWQGAKMQYYVTDEEQDN